jgi:hypothetical protein
VVFRSFAFGTPGGFDSAVELLEELLKRLQGLVNQAIIVHEDLLWFLRIKG